MAYRDLCQFFQKETQLVEESSVVAGGFTN